MKVLAHTMLVLAIIAVFVTVMGAALPQNGALGLKGPVSVGTDLADALLRSEENSSEGEEAPT
jgi:hypothetical protein